MAVVDPYSPCPCGSGQKFKWCCQKVEAVAERAHRLFEGGQVQAAIGMLDEGLLKEPHNPWLLTRKAVYLLQAGEAEKAEEPLRKVLEKQPGHMPAHFLLTRLALETEGAAAGAAQLQQALSGKSPEQWRELAPLVRLVGSFLADEGFYPAAIRHFQLEAELAPERAAEGRSPENVILANPNVPPWQKNLYRLAEVPPGLPAETEARFREALEWSEAGRWASAAASFELLAADPQASSAADRNLGLCRLWLGDVGAAAVALRRSIARAGATTEAVDVEALCQQIAPLSADDLVDHVQWIWPLRDRDGLLEILRANPQVAEQGSAPIDPDDPESPEVDQFALLNIPQPAPAPGLTVAQIPHVRGRILVGQEIAALEGHDDGRLDALGDRFTAMAGVTIAPAHPRAKVLNKIGRSTASLMWEWLLPEGLDPDEAARLALEQGSHLIREVWIKTPMAYLRGRTPEQAAAAGDAEVPLRAAVFQHESSPEAWRKLVDFTALRATLRIPPEPEIDPETVDIESLHVARLRLVPADRLNDERLVALYRRSRETGQVDANARATGLLIERPSARELGSISLDVLHTEMAIFAAVDGNRSASLDWVRRGRQAGSAGARSMQPANWDMLEIQLKARFDPPEAWVPDLAVVLERYPGDPASNQAIMASLVEMGLVHLVRQSEESNKIAVDTRPLHALLAEYGPRVTTSTGELGISATRGGLWTPGGGTPGGGGRAIWTPGSGDPSSPPSAPGKPGAEKPRLIIPGR